LGIQSGILDLFVMAVKRLVRRFKMVVRFIFVLEGFCGGGVMPVVAAVYDAAVSFEMKVMELVVVVEVVG
jgi:hypothetical protein